MDRLGLVSALIRHSSNRWCHLRQHGLDLASALQVKFGVGALDLLLSLLYLLKCLFHVGISDLFLDFLDIGVKLSSHFFFLPIRLSLHGAL